MRVVSQTVGTDELLLALASPEQVAALSELADNPEFSAVSREAAAYPRLPLHADAEAVLRFHPDIVLCADFSRAELQSQLRKSHVRLIVFDRYYTIEDAFANLRLLGKEIGAEAKADAVIADCRRRLAFLEQRLRGVRSAHVIAPSVYGPIPGADTTFQDLCDHAGAENLAATLGHLRGHSQPPAEQMLTWPVDYVVIGGHRTAASLDPLKALPPYAYMEVIKAGRAVLLKPYLLSCISFHRIEGYEMLAHALHPEAFR